MKKLPRARAIITLSTLATLLLLVSQGCVSVVPSFNNLMQGFFGLVLPEPRPVTSRAQFEAALSQVQHNGVSYRFRFIPTPGATPIPYEYGPDIIVQTTKVGTTSAAARLAITQPGASSLTHHIYSINSQDVTKVAAQVRQQ
jgi:hypothetical protein